MNNNLTLATVAVDKLLTNLGNSDFVTACGVLAIQNLCDYRLDMISDVFASFEGRLATEEEMDELQQSEMT